MPTVTGSCPEDLSTGAERQRGAPISGLPVNDSVVSHRAEGAMIASLPFF